MRHCLLSYVRQKAEAIAAGHREAAPIDPDEAAWWHHDANADSDHMSSVSEKPDAELEEALRVKAGLERAIATLAPHEPGRERILTPEQLQAAIATLAYLKKQQQLRTSRPLPRWISTVDHRQRRQCRRNAAVGGEPAGEPAGFPHAATTPTGPYAGRTSTSVLCLHGTKCQTSTATRVSSTVIVSQLTPSSSVDPAATSLYRTMGRTGTGLLQETELCACIAAAGLRLSKQVGAGP